MSQGDLWEEGKLQKTDKGGQEVAGGGAPTWKRGNAEKWKATGCIKKRTEKLCKEEQGTPRRVP